MNTITIVFFIFIFQTINILKIINILFFLLFFTLDIIKLIFSFFYLDLK